MSPDRRDNEAVWLDRWSKGDEGALKTLVARGQKQVYSTVLDLTGADPNTVYEIVVESAVETLQKISKAKGPFLLTLLRLVVGKCRTVKTASFLDPSRFSSVSPQRAGSLRITKEAFNDLSFDNRALLLLRDRLHLAYEDIASILGHSASEVKIQTVQARVLLRDCVKDHLGAMLKRAKKNL